MSTKRVPILDKFEWQKSVKDKDLSSPPTSPSAGDRYIVASSATGDWSGHENDIAQWNSNNNSWDFTEPLEGMFVFVEDEDELYYYTTTWQKFSGASSSDEKVKADSGDSTAGYLDSKVDNATIEVDTSNHQLRVKTGGIGSSHLASASVSQAKLKTSVGEVSVQNGQSVLTLPGGQYGFYPQTGIDITTGANFGFIMGWNKYDTSNNCWKAYTEGYNDRPYGTYITLYSSQYYQYAKAQQRYITSSGKDHWIFLLVDKETKQIIASYQAPDHPCYGQGGDEIDIPHPFGSYDPKKHEIVLVDNSILTELKPLINRKNTLLTLINEKCIIDDYTRPKYEPREIIEIDEYGDLKGDVLATIRTPDWAKIKISRDEIQLKRRMVEELPDFILYKKLRVK